MTGDGADVVVAGYGQAGACAAIAAHDAGHSVLVVVPGDVAATVAFLASDAAAALTGQTLCTDGGLVLR